MGKVAFQYDNRGGVNSEVRTGTSPYDLSYSYDQGGNRQTKVDRRTGNERYEVEYHYDLEAPTTCGSVNNRLMYYETWLVTEETVETEVRRADQCRVGRAHHGDYGPQRGIWWAGAHPTQTT